MDSEGLGPDSRKVLLGIARESIRAHLEGRDYQPDLPDDPALIWNSGAFVTLRCEGALRGCIGSLEGTRPLYLTVAEMACSAAFHDPRFAPLSAAEFEGTGLEISVLTPLRTLEDPRLVEVGRHGLIVSRGSRRGVLLPQVPVQFGWDRETFLEQTCRKAGLPPDAWRQGALLQAFEAEVFSELDPES